MGETILIVSNYGMRWLDEWCRTHPPAELGAHPTAARLADILRHVSVPMENFPWQQGLIDRGLAQAAEGLDRAAIALRYRRNPLQHLAWVVFEYTTACEFACAHCRNGGVPRLTEHRPEALGDVVDLLVPLGLRRFDFIGGEVTLHGDRWLEVVRRARAHAGVSVSVVTNGWFLGRHDFRAARERFREDTAYLAALADAGVTHVTFSLDGPEEVHEQMRRMPGLYRRIIAGFDQVRAAGLTPQVSLLLRQPLDEAGMRAWLAAVAGRLYTDHRDADPADQAARILSDPMNYVSHFIDIGRGAHMRKGLVPAGRVPDSLLRCKNFFRPYPSLRIQATGEISLCPLVDAGEGYGNVHAVGGLIHALNHLQDAIPYRLHAGDLLPRYRRLLDPALFGDRLDHVCSLRATATMLATRLIERGVRDDDEEAVHVVNLEVARKAGFLPPQPPPSSSRSASLASPETAGPS